MLLPDLPKFSVKNTAAMIRFAQEFKLIEY
jgi:hypothetical protein